MTPEGFLKRLTAGKTVNCIYRVGDLTGLISAWHHAGAFVLTWEECREGEQYDEAAYTRDARYKFETAEEVLAFVEKNGYSASQFEP